MALFMIFTKENTALVLTYYKGKHSPILDLLQRKTFMILYKENMALFMIFGCEDAAQQVLMSVLVSTK